MSSHERSSRELKPLAPDFYLEKTPQVARELLGKGLYLRRAQEEFLIEIVEVEAYLGSEDPASHAYRGLTERTRPMFDVGGTCYVYLSYGINFCMNVATQKRGIGQAVLLRAAAPLWGEAHMRARRTVCQKPRGSPYRLLNGPGKLTKALGIDLKYNGLLFTGDDFKIVDLGKKDPQIGNRRDPADRNFESEGGAAPLFPAILPVGFERERVVLFTEGTLNEIRNRMNIVELISEYIELKKSGQGYMGLCPFHGEKTPSFHVHPIKQCFHCFGCHKGGNIFTFLSAIEGLNFPDSVKRLAKRTGVEIVDEKTYRKETVKAVQVAELRTLEAIEWAAKYFNYLLTEKAEFRPALDYLKGRGITEKTIERFKLGVAPKGWNTLMDLMAKRGFTFNELVQAGLVIPKEGQPNQGYDRFRYRLMFPIHDPEGHAIGFGARQLDNDENQPKYINSPESPHFPKRRILYGLFENQRGIRLKGEGLIVEGYMDVIGLHQAGVQNAVATMGTALTEDHCIQLKSYTRRVVTVFDPDSAGADAWHRSVHIFLNAGIFAKDLSLPDGQDPDEFVLKEGAEAFYKLSDKAPRQVTKLLKEIASKGALSEEESAMVLSDLSPILIASRRLPDRAMLWDDISLVLKVSVPALKELSEATTRPSLAPEPAKKPGTISWPKRKESGPPPMPDPVGWQFFQASLESKGEFQKTPADQWKGGVKDARLQKWLEKLHVTTTPESWDTVLEEILAEENDPRLQAVVSAGLMDGPKKDNPATFQAILERVRGRKKELEIEARSAQVRLSPRVGDVRVGRRLLARLSGLRST